MIRVKVPATSANLGPGFDFMGAALSLYSYFSFEPSDEMRFDGCIDKYKNMNNLVVRSFQRALEVMGEKFFPIHLIEDARSPLARGLGSSSSCVVAGVYAANEMTGRKLSVNDMLDICTAIEGHPDNVAPCLLGGVVACFANGGNVTPMHFPCSKDWDFVTIVPDYKVHTAEARKVMKQDIDIKTSVYTSGHAIGFLRALETCDAELAGKACRDIMHEPYRKQLIPQFDELKEMALAEGAAAYFISGSGSTMIAMSNDHGVSAGILQRVQTRYPAFQVYTLKSAEKGAHLVA